MGMKILFFVLQVLDLITTVIGLRLGLSELNPIAALMINYLGLWVGIVCAKIMFPLFFVFLCFRFKKFWAFKWGTYWSLLVVVWNFVVILKWVIL